MPLRWFLRHTFFCVDPSDVCADIEAHAARRIRKRIPSGKSITSDNPEFQSRSIFSAAQLTRSADAGGSSVIMAGRFFLGGLVGSRG